MFPFCREVVSMDEYESYFNDIDPLSQYKIWRSKQIFSNKFYARTDKVQAVFIVSDPVDWGRDIQVFSSKLISFVKLLSLTGKRKKLTCGSFLFLDLFSNMRFYKIILFMTSNMITVWGNQYLLGRTMMIFQISMTALFILVLFGY